MSAIQVLVQPPLKWKVVSQARLLTPVEEESGHNPMCNSCLHTQQIFRAEPGIEISNQSPRV